MQRINIASTNWKQTNKEIASNIGHKKKIANLRVVQAIKTRNDDDELEELERKESEIKKLDIAIKFYTIKYFRIMYWFDDEECNEQLRRKSNLSDFSRMDCPAFFGFRKQDSEWFMVAWGLLNYGSWRTLIYLYLDRAAAA